MSWNYRIVRFKHPEFEEDDYYEIKEVFYDTVGKPVGYSDAPLGADTYDGLFKVAGMMQSAHAKPVLDESDMFKKETKMSTEPYESAMLDLSVDPLQYLGNDAKHTIVIDTSDGGQEFMINGQPSQKVEITFVGEWEYRDFLEQMRQALES